MLLFRMLTEQNFMLLAAAVLGLVFGSFLNVCVSRLPAGESIVHPRSRCPHCGTPIRWYDNIPVLSWLLLGARCRDCHQPISVRYPAVELLVAALWVACAYRAWGMSASPDAFSPLEGVQSLLLFGFRAASGAIFSWLLVGLATTDAEHYLLPDKLTIPGTILGVLQAGVLRPGCWGNAGFAPDWRGALRALLSAMAGALFILVLRWLYQAVRRREGLGLGDAKLMALIGAWLGMRQLGLVFVLAVVGGALISLLLLPFLRQKEDLSGWKGRQAPLGTFLCVAALYALFFGNCTVDWYLRTFWHL